MHKEEVVHVSSATLLSHKKERKNAICSKMQLEMIIPSKVSQKDKDKSHMTSFMCGIYNMTEMTLSMKQKQSHRHREQTFGCQGGEQWGRNGMGYGITRCKLVHLGWINNKFLLYSSGNCI